METNSVHPVTSFQCGILPVIVLLAICFGGLEVKAGTVGQGGDLPSIHDFLGTLTGHVTESDTGKGLQGMQVSASMAAGFKAEALDTSTRQIRGQGHIVLSRSQKYIAQTQADGFYSLVRLPAGTYHVWVEPENSGHIGSHFLNAEDISEAVVVEVNRGAITSGVNFSLAPGGKLSGSVRRKMDKQPLSGIKVVVYKGQDTEPVGGAVTSAAGTYTIAGLRSGEYFVKVEGADDFVSLFFGNTTVRSDSSLVEVTVGSLTSGVDFMLTGFGGVSGRLTASGGAVGPVSSVLVNAYPFDSPNTKNPPVGQGVSNQDGNYLIDKLPPGSYRIEANPQSVYVRENFSAAGPEGDAAPVVIKDGAITTEINFTLAVGGAISGQVIGEAEGAPLVNARVSAQGAANGDEIDRGMSDATGKYEIERLPPGSYRVFVHFPNYVDEFFNNVNDAAQARLITVEGGKIQTGIDFQLVQVSALPLGSIHGVITEYSGSQPLPKICVYAYSAGTDQLFGFTCSDSDGRYQIAGLLPGSYRVCVKAKKDYTEGCYANGAVVESPSAQIITVADSIVEDINFRLHRLGSVSGMLSRAVDGYQIGTYTIPDLPPGNYYIRIHGENTGYEDTYYNNTLLVSGAVPVSVSGGQETGSTNFNMTVVAP